MRNRILPPHIIYTARESEAVSIVTADFVQFRLDLLTSVLVVCFVLQCSYFVILGRISLDLAKGWWVVVLSLVSL